MSQFGSVMTAMVTPFDKDLNIDFRKVDELVDYLISEGSDSLLVCGTTGESPTLSSDEKLQLFRAVKQAARGRVPIIGGTGSYNTANSINFTKTAQVAGIDAVLLVNPYYNKPPQEGLYRHFKAIASATTLPVMVYNIPGRTGVNLEPATLARLVELPNVVAVKEASGNLDQVSEIIATIGVSDGVMTRAMAATGRAAVSGNGQHKTFNVYSGDDSLTLPMLSLGARGVVSVASHVVGPDLRRMVNAFLEDHPGQAADLHRKLFPIFKGLFMTTSPIPVKAALKLRGIDCGGLRPPLVEATPEQIDRLRQLLDLVGAAR